MLDCLDGVLPGWAFPLAAFCVALMILVRPAYNLFKRLFRRT